MADSKWTPLDKMSTDDKINETLALLRGISDALSALGSNPMLAAFVPGGFGPKR